MTAYGRDPQDPVGHRPDAVLVLRVSHREIPCYGDAVDAPAHGFQEGLDRFRIERFGLDTAHIMGSAHLDPEIHRIGALVISSHAYQGDSGALAFDYRVCGKSG